MKIIQHHNTHFPDKLIYKCTIGYNTKFGSLEDVTEWRDDHVVNADYYAKLSESNTKASGEFYKKLSYKGD
jgi:hypothetical protein